MKILQINSVYKAGSTGKIVNDITKGLIEKGHDVLCLYGIGEHNYDNNSKKICSNWEHKINALIARITGIPFGGYYLSNKRVVQTIKSFHPDIVHVHCINGFTINIYKLFEYLGKHNIKTVVTLHAEFFHTGSCGHAYECEKWKDHCHNCPTYKRNCSSWFFDRSSDAWERMNKAFSYFKKDNLIITAVSPWLADRAKKSAILGKFRIVYVPNGLDPEVFHFRESKGLIEKGKYKKVILYVAPYFNLDKEDLKGGRYIPKIARLLPHYKFVVVASRITESLPDLPDNVQVWGRAKTQEELAQLYSEADITLLLSKRETFSMVTAESLCCGTPVVGFLAGGPESITIPEYSNFIEYGNINKLCSSLKSNRFTKDLRISNKAIGLFSKTKMATQYLKAYNDLLSGNI